MDAKCRVCHRPSVDALSGLPVCHRHRAMLLELLRDARELERHLRLLGFGVPLHNVDDLSRETLLVCDRSTVPSEAHSWSGIPGDVCYWCLSSYVSVYTEQRTKLLESIELNPEDTRYADEVLRRGRQLANAVGIGLITPDEARSTFEKWAAHV